MNITISTEYSVKLSDYAPPLKGFASVTDEPLPGESLGACSVRIRNISKALALSGLVTASRDSKDIANMGLDAWITKQLRLVEANKALQEEMKRTPQGELALKTLVTEDDL